MQLSLELWDGLAGDLGLDFEFARPGGLRVALSEREFDMLNASVSLQRGRGFDVELLQGDALRAAAPWLGPEVRAASACAEDGFSVPLR